MAFTSLYVTVSGAGAHDGTSEANAWSWAEMIAEGAGTGPPAESLVNAKKGSFSEGTHTLPSNGTSQAPVLIRGYNTSPDDLDTLGRANTGELVTTNFPTMTITGALAASSSCIMQNFILTGALSSKLIAGAAADRAGFVSCSFLNTQNNASAGCLRLDDNSYLLNCDFECSGAAHSIVVDLDRESQVHGCRFKGVADATLLQTQSIECSDLVLWNTAGVGRGILFDVAVAAHSLVRSSTFYNLDEAVQFSNNAHTGNMTFLNNHVTDCGKWLENLNATPILCYEGWTRIRDVTTPRTSILQVQCGPIITTDTGGASTDYTDAANGDFRLISGAPGYGTGMIPHSDIGAAQHVDPAGGGGLLVHPGTSGGARG